MLKVNEEIHQMRVMLPIEGRITSRWFDIMVPTSFDKDFLGIEERVTAEVRLSNPLHAIGMPSTILRANTVTFAVDGDCRERLIIFHERPQSKSFDSSYSRYAIQPTNWGGAMTFLFDEEGRMVPELHVKSRTKVWLILLDFYRSEFRDGTNLIFPQVGLWFREGKSNMPDWQVNLWQLTMLPRMRRR